MRCQNRIYGAEFSKKEIEETAKNSRLLSTEIEFNRTCNFNCIYCYVENDSRKNELTREEFCNVINQAKDLGARKIIILGGEPMLYPHIMEMVQFIRKQGMDIELFTNGTNITKSTARVLSKHGVIVVLKMNTFDEKIQDMLSSREGAYKQIWEAFENLKQAGYPSENLHLGVSTIICRQNIDELVKMWDWLREQKISPYFEMITPQGKAKENSFLEVKPLRVKELFYQIADIDRKKYGYYWLPQPPLVGGRCLRHLFSCTVNAYGDVMPCIGVTIPVGNIREKKLGDIIRESEVIQGLRNYQQTIKGPCSECIKSSECYGCRGTAYQLTGDYLASDPLCWENLDKQNDIIRLPVDASMLVPHKPPMLIVDKLIEVKERASVSEMKVSEDTIFVREDGKLDETSFPEIISQSIAAQNGFKNLGNWKSKSEGLLLGIKNLEILDNAQLGDKLRVCVYKTAKYGEFGIIKGEIFKGEDLIARGEIKVWHSEK